MEETLQLILKEITSIKEEIKGVNIRLDKVEDVQAEIKTDVKEINRKTSVIFDQTAGLTEFTSSTTSSLSTLANEVSEIKEELFTVENLTLSNRSDIIRLKRIK